MLMLFLWTGTLAWRRGATRLATTCVLSTIAMGAALIAFSYGYAPNPASPGWTFNSRRPWLYLVFVSRMLGNVFWMPEWPRSGAAIGWLTFGLLVLTFADDLRRIVIDRDHSPSETVVGFVFIAFSLLFGVATAIGRLHLGFHAARALRYATLLLPGVMAIYLHIQMRAEGWTRCVLLSLFVVWMSLAFLPLRRDVIVEAGRFYKIKRMWVETYRNTSSITEADRAAHGVVPNSKSQRLPEKLEFLRRNNLSLFAEHEPGRVIEP
jgi:hypothetical protein